MVFIEFFMGKHNGYRLEEIQFNNGSGFGLQVTPRDSRSTPLYMYEDRDRVYA